MLAQACIVEGGLCYLNKLLTYGCVIMNKFVKFSMAAAVVAFLSGCTGSVYNKEKNCDYDYLLHPAISVSKIIGGCGPVAK